MTTVTLKDNINITFAEYRDELVKFAAYILDDAVEFGFNPLGLVHERVKGHRWIRFSQYNAHVLHYASNPNAWEDCYSAEDIDGLVIERGLDGARTVQAYFAMLEDLQVALYAMADLRGVEL